MRREDGRSRRLADANGAGAGKMAEGTMRELVSD